jgi:tetratricopeptide (TPR) repeat protein
MMGDVSINTLLEDLKSPTAEVRDRATQALWRIWFEQKGEAGLEMLRRAQHLLERGDFVQAETVLTQLVQEQPDFAEAWNRRAVLYFLKRQYRKAIADCQQVTTLNPIHFGAFHGLGLCHAALGEYPLAIRAFRQALEIQPYSLENQRLLLECTAKLE